MNAHSIAEDIASMSLVTLLEYRASYERATAQTHHPPLMQALYRETLSLIHQQIERRVARAAPGIIPSPAALPPKAPLVTAPVGPASPGGRGAAGALPARRAVEQAHQLSLF